MFKKVVAFFIIMVIMLSVAPINICFAAPISSLSLTPTSLDKMQADIYSFIEKNLLARNSSFKIILNGEFIKSIDEDDEPYFGVETPFVDFKTKANNEYTATIFKPSVSDVFSVSMDTVNGGIYPNFKKTITLTYDAKFEETISETNKVLAFAKDKNINVIKINSSMSEYDKVLKIHNYLINNFKYDPNLTSSSPYQVAINKKLYTCESFSALFYIMLKDAGIESRIILKGTGSGFAPSTADGFNHAWNEVRVNGNWYHVDITWDATTKSSRYFLKSNDTFLVDHRWDTSNYPKAPKNYGGTSVTTTKAVYLPKKTIKSYSATSTTSKAIETTLKTTEIPTLGNVITQATTTEPTTIAATQISSPVTSKKNNSPIIIVTIAAFIILLGSTFWFFKIRK